MAERFPESQNEKLLPAAQSGCVVGSTFMEPLFGAAVALVTPTVPVVEMLVLKPVMLNVAVNGDVPPVVSFTGTVKLHDWTVPFGDLWSMGP